MWRIEKRDKAVVFALLLAALSVPVTVGLSWLFPPPVQSNSKNGPQNESNGLVFLIAVESFATAVIAVFSVLQYREGQKSSERQLRAYVSIREGGIEGSNADITMENFGQTPAYKLTYWADCTLNGQGDIPAFKMPEGAEMSSEIIVGPTGQFRVQPRLIDKRRADVPQSQYRTERTRAMIHAFGKITYRDVFDVEHTTEFFLQTPYPRGAFYAFGPHNTAD